MAKVLMKYVCGELLQALHGLVCDQIWTIAMTCRPLTVLIVVKIKKDKFYPCQALRLCTGRTAHRGSRGIALLFHDHDTRRW